MSWQMSSEEYKTCQEWLRKNFWALVQETGLPEKEIAKLPTYWWADEMEKDLGGSVAPATVARWLSRWGFVGVKGGKKPRSAWTRGDDLKHWSQVRQDAWDRHPEPSPAMAKLFTPKGTAQGAAGEEEGGKEKKKEEEKEKGLLVKVVELDHEDSLVVWKDRVDDRDWNTVPVAPEVGSLIARLLVLAK